MKGAREYKGLFETGQYGRLYIVSGSHARGATLGIYVLPEGAVAKPNGPNNACLNSDAVEVYGVIGGQPGWTEEYGWLHHGAWVADFDRLVTARRAEIADREEGRRIRKESDEKMERERKAALLATYK
jgi:hypothetical protein